MPEEQAFDKMLQWMDFTIMYSKIYKPGNEIKEDKDLPPYSKILEERNRIIHKVVGNRRGGVVTMADFRLMIVKTMIKTLNELEPLWKEIYGQ